MNGKPKLVLKLPKALQDDSKASNAQSVKPQKKRKQPEGDRSVHLSPEKPAPVKQEPQGSVPAKKKFKVLGPGSLKPSSSGFASPAGPSFIKPRISVKFGAAGKPSVSISGGPPSGTQRQHAAPQASSGVPKDTNKAAVRESPRKPLGSEPKVKAEQGRGPEKKKKKFKRLDQANGVSAPGIRVSLPKASLQSGALPEAFQTPAQDASAAPSFAAAASLPNGVAQAPDSQQAPLEQQKQPGMPVHAAPPKPARVLPSGPPEQSQVQRVIQRMQKKDPYRIFAEVPSEEMAPGYTRIVTRPMAFSIMWERFRKGEYMTWEELQADLNQMFRNAMTYNRPETVFHKQAAKMLQIGAKVVDAVRMGPKPVFKAKALAPAPRPPREGTQLAKQPDEETKSVPEQRVLRPQRRPAKAAATAKTVKRTAAAQYRPKAGVRAATAAALSAAEDNLPRQTFHSRATRVFGCHQWKGLALGATAEDVPFSSGRFLARPSTGALPSGEQYAASLERFAGGLKMPVLQKVLERKAQALKAPTAPPPPPPQIQQQQHMLQQQQQQQQQKALPMQMTGSRNVVPSSGGVPIGGSRPAWQTAPLYIQGASGALPQHANIHAQLAASASQSLPRAAPSQMQPRAASVPVQPAISLPLQIAGLFSQHQQPQAHVLAALQKQAEALMAQHQRNTMAAAAAAAQSRPSSAASAGKSGVPGQPSGQAGQAHVTAGQKVPQVQSVGQQSGVQPRQMLQAQPQAISQQLLQQQMNQLAQQYRQVHPAPAAPEQQNRPP